MLLLSALFVLSFPTAACVKMIVILLDPCGSRQAVVFPTSYISVYISKGQGRPREVVAPLEDAPEQKFLIAALASQAVQFPRGITIYK